jgi:PKD domain/Phage tail baseplate hub (GPD)/FG-GAP-like repeat/FG-GAP repeat
MMLSTFCWLQYDGIDGEAAVAPPGIETVAADQETTDGATLAVTEGAEQAKGCNPNSATGQFFFTFAARDYCVQYRESDFDFASRLMEEEGNIYFVSTSGGGVFVAAGDVNADGIVSLNTWAGAGAESAFSGLGQNLYSLLPYIEQRLPDSVWIDLGFPIQQTPGGSQFKPLFAFYVEDLDHRVNLNVVVDPNVKTGDYNGDAGLPILFLPPLNGVLPQNEPPAVSLGNDVTLVEGQTFSRLAAFTDDYSTGPWTGTVDYGDGSREQPLVLNADKSFSLNHLYTDDGVYPVTVRVTDEQGLVGIDTLTVIATNALPRIASAQMPRPRERQYGTLDVAVDPTNPHDELTLTIDWGDGSPSEVFACPSDPSVLSFYHRYAHDGQFNVKLSLADDDGSVDTSSVLANVQNVDIIVVGTDAGRPGLVRVLDANTHTIKSSFLPFGPAFRGGVRVAAGDVNGDGLPDIITAPGPGRPAPIKVFDGASGQPLATFGFEKTFFGGWYVAAGDVNGDGLADIIAGRGSGKPEVRVLDAITHSLLSSFQAYGARFTGGVHVAAGDLNGDGTSEIITGPGAGKGGGQVKAFSGLTGSPLISFLPYSPGFQGGVFVAAGDLNDDGHDEIITGAGPGAGPHVKVFDAATLQAIDSFFAYNPSFQGGVRVAAGDVDGDGKADIITGAGSGPTQPVRLFDGETLAVLDSLFALPPQGGLGTFVAGSR